MNLTKFLGKCSSFAMVGTILLTGCASHDTLPSVAQSADKSSPDYYIGPLDSLNIFVWRNPELTQNVAVRPDGRVSIPLIDDLQAAGKTPTQLSRDIETQLKKFVQDPIVTVMVTGFNGPYTRQIRVVGEEAHPQAIPFRDNMTLLDVMILVGGLTPYAAGNRATIVRTVGTKEMSYQVRVSDLIKEGDISANVKMLPGDVLIIPQAWF